MRFKKGDRVRLIGWPHTPSQRLNSWICAESDRIFATEVYCESDPDHRMTIANDRLTKTTPLEMLALQAE